MPKGRGNTDPPTPYSARDEAEMEAALDRAFRDYEEAAPTTMDVTAQIEWGGVVDRANDGVRRTRLDNLDLSGVQQARERVRQTTERAGEVRPATSYTAKGWRAQFRQLMRSGHGRELADRAGLNPASRTMRRWRAGGNPSRANRERIADAYRHMSTWRVDRAQAETRNAQHELANALSGALRERYGTEIRLRDIRQLRLDR